MFAVLAAVAFGCGWVLDVSKADVPVALTPGALTLTGLFFLALHLCGVGAGWWARRP